MGSSSQVILPPPPGFFRTDASASVPEGTPPPPPGFFPIGNQPATLPNVTNEDLKNAGKSVLQWLPPVAAGVGAALAPEGVLPGMAFAALGGAGGELARQAASGEPLDFSKAGMTGGEQGLLEGGGRGLQKIASAVLSHWMSPQRMYQSSISPPPSWGKEKIGRLVNAGMEEGIPASEYGFHKTGEAWKQLNADIENVIGSDPAKPVDPVQAVAGLNELRLKWTMGSGDPAFLRQIDEVEKNFLARHPTLTGDSAQDAKKALYQEVRLQNPNAWDVTKPLPLDLQAKQSIAAGLKEQLETLYPGIKEMNAKEGALIELERALNRFVAREGNKRISSYFGPLAAAGTYGVTHSPQAAAGVFAASLLRNAFEDPAVKSRLAIVLSKIPQKAVNIAGRVINPQNAVRGVEATIPPPPNP